MTLQKSTLNGVKILADSSALTVPITNVSEDGGDILASSAATLALRRSAIVVDSVSDLATVELVDGHSYMTLGYNDSADGSGNLYRYDPNSSETIDNNFILSAPVGRFLAIDQESYVSYDPSLGRSIAGEGNHNIVETGLDAVVCVGGRDGWPNYIGTKNGTIVGTDLQPGGADFNAANTGYIDESAGVSSVLGGYDSINNQAGSVIVHSDHSVSKYDSSGHSSIVGGSYVYNAGGRSGAFACNDFAVLDGSSFSGGILSYQSEVSGQNAFSMGVRCNVYAKYSIARGHDLEVKVGHDYSDLSGDQATSPGGYSQTFGAGKLVEVDDARSWTQTTGRRTTDDSLTNFPLITTLPSNKVLSAMLVVEVVAQREDGDKAMSCWRSEFGIWWDGPNSLGKVSNTIGSSGPNSTPSRSLSEIVDDIGVSPPTIRLNSGELRARVEGLSSTNIKWVVKYSLVSTLVS